MLSGHSKAVTGLVLTMDDRSLVSGSEDGSLRVWDTLSRQCLRQITPLKKHPLTNLQVSSTNRID